MIQVFSTARNISLRRFSFSLQKTRYYESVSIFPDIGLVQTIQAAIVGYHDISGLPWWATFATSAFFIRMSMFPLVRLQILESNRTIGKAAPEIAALWMMRNRRRAGQTLSFSEEYELVRLCIQGSWAVLKINQFSLTKVMMYPIAIVATFMSFFFSMRSMINSHQYPDLMTGGLLWFSDLTQVDATGVLPFTAFTVGSAAIAYSFHSTNSPQSMASKYLLDFYQHFLVIGLPMYFYMPSGIFCYWIPSSIYSILQRKITKTPYFQNLLGLPLTPSQQQQQREQEEMKNLK